MASIQAVLRAGAKRRAASKVRSVPTLVAALVVAGLAYWAWANAHKADAASANMITGPVTRGDLLETVSATGSVTAQTGAEVKIGPQLTGVVKHLYADVGAKLQAGQVIAELDLPDIKAQLQQAQANANAARTKYAQSQTALPMAVAQDSNAVAQAQANLRSAQAKLASTMASESQQSVQTPNDINKAQASLGVAQAALATAQANYQQTQAGANLQIANAQEALNQAKATANNTQVTLNRNQQLYDQGFQAASAVDDAKAANLVAQSNVQTQTQNVALVRQKVTADLETAKDQVTQARQNVAAAQAALKQARAETYATQAQQANVKDAQAAVHQSEAALRTAIANLTNDQIQRENVQQSQESMQAAEAQVAYNQAQVNKTFLRSPISGTVLQLAAQQGETLAAGLSAPTLIVVADLNRLQVDVFVDETDIGRVRLGQPADIQVDAFPKRTFKGHVVKVASGSTIQQGVVTYDVTIAFDKRGRAALKPDMTATATIQTGKLSNVLLVPSEAVKLGSHGSTVQVVTRVDGKPNIEVRKVKTGGTDGVNTEIREGLKEGETIVLASTQQGPGFGPRSPFGPQGGGGRGGGGGGGRGR